jgi:hypothetical protein
VWACYRFTVKLRENQPALADCLDAIVAALHAERPTMGYVGNFSEATSDNAGRGAAI